MSNTAVVSTSLRTNGKVDLAKAFKLRIKNKLTYQEIANQLGVCKQSVHKRLKEFDELIKDPEATEVYENNKAELLSAVERKLLVQLTDPKKLKDASLNNVAYTFSQVSNSNRLARGEATQNVNIRSLELHAQSELEATIQARDKLLNALEVGDEG